MRDIIVIGASAGGFEAILQLASQFPADLPASVFITLHTYGRGNDYLPSQLNRTGPLPAAHAVDGEPIRKGRVYVAPPDYHLILRPGHVELSHGPRENLQRPCINTMFRSAATAYTNRVAGVVLSGLLDDGAAGLWEIQRQNGATIAQDPEEATYRSMPESAIRGVNVQYIVRLAEMPTLLSRLAMDSSPHRTASPAPEPSEEAYGQVCPECGGAMTRVHLGHLYEYRCHTGHRLGLKTMIAEKARYLEQALGTALSQSEELVELLETSQHENNGTPTTEIQQEIAQRKKEQESLRTILRTSKPSEVMK